MKKTLSFIGLTLAGICFIVTGYFCQFYYTRYRETVTETKWRLNDFNARLGKLEEHKSRELTPIQISGWISTTDRKTSDDWPVFAFPEGNSTGPFTAAGNKGGPTISPEIRIARGSTNDFEFNVSIPDHFGKVTDAWFTHGGPFQDLTAFDRFRVFRVNGTNAVQLSVLLKPGASVGMRFEIMVLCQQ